MLWFFSKLDSDEPKLFAFRLKINMKNKTKPTITEINDKVVNTTTTIDLSFDSFAVVIGVFIGVPNGVLMGVSVNVFNGVSIGVFIGVSANLFNGVSIGVLLGVFFQCFDHCLFKGSSNVW